MSTAPEKILENLSPYFHKDYDLLKRQRLRPSESVIFGADCGFRYSFMSLGGFGYLIVSSERIICVAFQPETGFFGTARHKIPIEQPNLLHHLLDEARYKNWGIYDIPHSTLTSKERDNRQVEEVELVRVLGVNCEDYEISTNTTIVELRLDLLGESHYQYLKCPFLYNSKDGNELYTLLGKMPSSVKDKSSISSVTSDISSMIESLAKLHAAGILSDQEFEAKKRDLLSRL